MACIAASCFLPNWFVYLLVVLLGVLLFVYFNVLHVHLVHGVT